MYVGRIVAVGATPSSYPVVAYRVSSRSFPNRQCCDTAGGIGVVPKPGFEEDIKKNPYIAYNCLRRTGDCAIASNGSHTEPLAEKIGDGLPVRDALISVLHGMDFEHDDYSTPRIAGVVSVNSTTGYLGIVRNDALLVRSFTLQAGQLFYVATYDVDQPSDDFCDDGYSAESAHETCSYMMGHGVFSNFEHAVTAAAAVGNTRQEFDVAYCNP